MDAPVLSGETLFTEQNYNIYQSCIPQWGPNAIGTLPSLLFLLGCTRIYSSKYLFPKRPHIVFIVADDLGWNDVSFHGSKQIPTPNVDAIARDGIILNQYYVQPLCSPSRGSLMTGKYPIRIGFQHIVIHANAPWGLPLSEKILPQYLKELRYSTHAVGKWHLGYFKKEYLPTERGFDSFFGYYNGVEDYFTHENKEDDMIGLDLHDNEQNVWQYNGTYGPDLFTTKAKNVILEHDQSKPLFLYFAQQSPHSGNFDVQPLQAPTRYVDPMVGIEDSKSKIFAGMVSSMDHSVGEIFDALEATGMLDDTLFIFTSDNGGAPQDARDGTSGSNWPLKGAKRTLWEGGVRGTSFIWSSFLRQRGGVYNGLMHISDWLPTILSAVGCHDCLNTLPENMDGINQWPSILNGFSSPRSEILLNIDAADKTAALRKGRFKLVKGSFENGKFDKWYDQEGKKFSITHSSRRIFNERLYMQNYLKFLRRSKAARILWYKYNKDPILTTSCQTYECKMLLEVECPLPPPLLSTCNSQQESCLYDVISDPCEYYNIAAQFPELTADMEDLIEKYKAVSIPAKNLDEDPAANPVLHGNAWVPWK